MTLAFWGWQGWSALGAIATLFLAFVTWRLAASTRRLAAEAGDETRANWRPVVVVDRACLIGVAEGALMFSIRNVGRGPVLQLAAYVMLDEDSDSIIRPRDLADVVAPGETIALQFPAFGERTSRRALVSPPFPGWSSFTGRLTYEDVSYAAYVTEFTIGLRSDGAGELLTQRYLGRQTASIRERMLWRIRLTIWQARDWIRRRRGQRMRPGGRSERKR